MPVEKPKPQEEEELLTPEQAFQKAKECADEMQDKLKYYAELEKKMNEHLEKAQSTLESIGIDQKSRQRTHAALAEFAWHQERKGKPDSLKKIESNLEEAGLTKEQIPATVEKWKQDWERQQEESPALNILRDGPLWQHYVERARYWFQKAQEDKDNAHVYLENSLKSLINLGEMTLEDIGISQENLRGVCVMAAKKCWEIISGSEANWGSFLAFSRMGKFLKLGNIMLEDTEVTREDIRKKLDQDKTLEESQKEDLLNDIIPRPLEK